jgi:hypothetical protein
MPSVTDSPLLNATPLDFNGGLVLVDEARNRLLAYEGSARAVWDAAAAGIGAREIEDEVRRHGGEAAAGAVATLLRHWQDEGLTGAREVVQEDRDRPVALTAGLDLAWRCRVGGRAIGFRTNDPELADQLHLLLGSDDDIAPPLEEIWIDHAREGYWTIGRGERVILSTDDSGLLRGAVYQACLEAIHDSPDWRALIHGAAVAIGDRAVGLPAPSGSGKTTLTGWLIAHGFDYLADDLLAILGDGRVAPWPMPLSVKPGSLAVLQGAHPRLDHAPTIRTKGMIARLLEAPQASWDRTPAELGALVFPRYDPAGDGALRRVRPLEALKRLVNDRVWIGYPLTVAAVQRFLDFLAEVPAYAIDYADLAQPEAAIRALLSK